MVFKKGNIPWSKGKKLPHTKEWKENHSNIMKLIESMRGVQNW